MALAGIAALLGQLVGQLPADNYHFVNNVDLQQMSDQQFTEVYRMSKVKFEQLYDLIKHELCAGIWGRPSFESKKKLLAVLRYYAEGEIQRSAGDHIGCSQSTIQREIVKVSEAIARLLPQFVRFPHPNKFLEVRGDK